MQAQNLLKMVRLLFGILGSWFRSQNNMALENVALRQQLASFKQRRPPPVLANADRALWVLLRTILVEMERRSGHRHARDRGPLASQRVSALLGRSITVGPQAGTPSNRG